MHILFSWLILSFAVFVTARLLPGFKLTGGFGSAVVIAALFGALNWLIGWLLFFVIGVGTLGLGFLLSFLTRWLVTAILLKLVDALSTRLRIRDFGSAFIAALLISAIGTVGQLLVAHNPGY